MLNSGPGNSWIQIADEEKSALWSAPMGYDYHQRKPQSLSWQWAPYNRWPNSGFMSGDVSVPLCLFSQDAQQNDIFGPWNLGISGHSRPYFIRGICKDGNGNILGGAHVHVYDTATNVFEAQIDCDDRGVFEIPCLSTQPHYLRAYYASGNLAGASLDTLIPTL